MMHDFGITHHVPRAIFGTPINFDRGTCGVDSTNSSSMNLVLVYPLWLSEFFAKSLLISLCKFRTPSFMFVPGCSPVFPERKIFLTPFYSVFTQSSLSRLQYITFKTPFQFRQVFCLGCPSPPRLLSTCHPKIRSSSKRNSLVLPSKTST